MILRILSAGVMLFAASMVHAANPDDVCSVRPDLCDDARSNVQTKKQVQAAAAKSQGCRKAGVSYSITQADLPICAASQPSAQASRKAHSDDDLYDDSIPAITAAPAKRGLASVPKLVVFTGPKAVSFDDYLAKNAMNPALSTKVADHQRAFVDAPVATTLTPSDGVSNGGGGGGGGNATTGVSSAPAGGMVISTPAGNVVVPTSGGGGGNSAPSDGFSSVPGS